MQTTQTLLWKRHDGVCSACVCCCLQRLSGAPRRAATLVRSKKNLRCCAVILASPPNPNNSSAQQRKQPGNNLISRRCFNLSPRDGTGGNNKSSLIPPALVFLFAPRKQDGVCARPRASLAACPRSLFTLLEKRSTVILFVCVLTFLLFAVASQVVALHFFLSCLLM